LIVPPIKSQGIKTKLVPWINDVAGFSNATGRWVEPFLGTGVVAFNSGFDSALLGDNNPHLINFYQNIKDGVITPDSMKQYLQIEGELLKVANDNGYDHYRLIRDRFNEAFDSNDFLFLSRAGFNGMIRFNKKGKWNIPFCKKPNRFSKSYITKIVNQVGKVRNIINEDWEFRNCNFDEIILEARENDIIYCDPPYYGRYVDYYNSWSEEDETRLFELLEATNAKFILSTWHHNNYRENEMVNRYWNKFNVVTMDHFYHSGGNIENRNTVVEALVFNFNADIVSHNHKRNMYENVNPQLQFVGDAIVN